MKWIKLGKIFEPQSHGLEYAQSPQAIVFDHFIRIYFSTRTIDSTGKFLSDICFVDMSKDFKDIIRISEKNVIPLGELGCFDEHGIFPISPFKFNNKIYAYTTGWSRRVSVSVETSIGLAISQDNGLTFKKRGMGPIMSSTLHEPFLVGDAFVKEYLGSLHMWYIYGTKWITYDEDQIPERVYKIGHATSNDGISWSKEGNAIIPDFIDENECQALPTVFNRNNRYHMYFCYRDAKGFRNDPSKAYRLGYAYSDDLITWTRDESLSGIGREGQDAWDSKMMCYPNTFESDGNVYLLYNGNEFGKYGFGAAKLND